MTPEFALIEKYFTRPVRRASLGVGDDCALLPVAAGCEIAVSTDTLVSGVHFFADADPRKLGHKALAVNLSDLAAMGAEPRFCTLALTLPRIDEAWLASFSAGMLALADAASIELVGGDTTRGPLSITITVLGEVPAGQALRRHGAQAGDDVWVSGELGGAALALAHLQGGIGLEPGEFAGLAARLHEPQPRLALGLALRGVASAAIDVSDGLIADLGHICERSRLHASLEWERVPMPALLAAQDMDHRMQCALAGGDDYELCFSAPVAAREKLDELADSLALRLTRVGRLDMGRPTVEVRDVAGLAMALPSLGFDHFAAKEGAGHES